MNYHGTAHKVGDHIDTDAIIPARYMTNSDPEQLGSKCMEGLEPGWNARVKKGDIMVAGRNFGCGSSREHAPVAIFNAGMPVVVAHSFARIFYRNSFNMGLLLLEIGDEVSKINDNDELDIDTEKGIITNKTNGAVIPFPPLPESMAHLLRQGGLIPYVKAKLGA